MTSKFSSSNNAVRRISQEVKEFLESERQMEDGTDDDQQQEKDGSMMVDNNAFATWAEPLEDDIFEWHFAIYGAEGTRERRDALRCRLFALRVCVFVLLSLSVVFRFVGGYASNTYVQSLSLSLFSHDRIILWIILGTAFEGGIYHGRILLPVEYPFKPPNFMLLTPNGRFETLTKICLSITSYHAEHWQPSWSVRTALTAIRAFMVTPSEGALGGIDFSEEQRRELAEKSRAKEVNFTFGSEKRREVTRLVHEKMLGRMGKAKQAARKMAMEKREREEKDARERSDGGNGTNAEAPTTSTATLEQQQQQQQQQQQRTQPREQQQQQQTPSPTPSPRNAANNENNENDDDVQRQRNSRTTQTTTRSIERRPASPEQQQQRQQRDPDHRTSAIKLLDSISVCLIVAIVAILLKRCMWIPPSL